MWFEQVSLTLGDLEAIMAKLQEQKTAFSASVLAPRTLEAYELDWRQFQTWCGEHGRDALPSTIETVGLYLTWLVSEDGRRISTAERRLAAIAYKHKLAGHPPPLDLSLRALLTGARRKLRQRSCAKAALTLDQLRRILRELGDGPVGVRNRALLLFGFSSAMRRSEISALRMSDLNFLPEGMRVHVPFSKSDQDGEGRWIGIFPGKRKETCPITAMRKWLALRGDWDGPVFSRLKSNGAVERDPIEGERIAQIVKQCVRLIGLDPAHYAGHSLRAGLVTTAATMGMSQLAIMQRTGHKQVQTLKRYFRPADAFAIDILANAL